MKDLNIKKQVLKSAAQIIIDKEAVRSYIKGKTSLNELDKNGIKFAKLL